MTAQDLPLIDGFIDGTLTEAELQQVKERLLSDEIFRDELELALHLRGLTAAARPGPAAAFSARVLQACAEISLPAPGEASAASFEAKVLRKLPRRRPPRPAAKSWRTPLLLLAAGFLLGLSSWWLLRPPVPEELACCTNDTSGFVIRGETSLVLKNGLSLIKGDLLSVAAGHHAQLHYPDGTEIDCFPSTQLRLDSQDGAKWVELQSGAISLAVKPQPPDQPMVLSTAQSRCTVRGTQFELYANAQQTQLHVNHGKVQMNGAKSGEVLVTAGHFATATAQEMRLSVPGEALCRSPVLRAGSAPYPICVPLRGSRKLFLYVSDNNDHNFGDHAAWIMPRLSGPAGSLDLTTLPWKRAKSGNIHIPVPQCNTGLPAFPRGFASPHRYIYTHAVSLIEYDIPPGYDFFEAEGVLSVSPLARDCSLVFEVFTELPAAQAELIWKQPME